MIHYIATIENGQVKSLKLSTGDNPAEGVQEDGTTIVHIDFPIENRIDFIETNYWDGEWKTREPSPNIYSTWNGSSWEWDLEDLMIGVRNVRNGLLSKSDWTQMPDSPLTDKKKKEWKKYRDELRGLEFVSDDISSVSDVTWPKEPK